MREQEAGEAEHQGFKKDISPLAPAVQNERICCVDGEIDGGVEQAVALSVGSDARLVLGELCGANDGC